MAKLNQGCNDKCTGEKLGTYCIVKEGEKHGFDSFDAMVDYLIKQAKANESVESLDFKTLSIPPFTNITKDNLLQFFIDKEVQRSNANSSITSQANPISGCNPDVSALDNCNTCNKSLCDKLELMDEEIVKLKTRVRVLEENI